VQDATEDDRRPRGGMVAVFNWIDELRRLLPTN
jgi:hypothetical protein